MHVWFIIYGARCVCVRILHKLIHTMNGMERKYTMKMTMCFTYACSEQKWLHNNYYLPESGLANMQIAILQALAYTHTQIIYKWMNDLFIGFVTERWRFFQDQDVCK